jgi:hypothetical protein
MVDLMLLLKRIAVDPKILIDKPVVRARPPALLSARHRRR